MADLTVSEIFGPTVQGEGPSAGRRCGFVRVGLCNLNCSWCDTPYTWDWKGENGKKYYREEELSKMTILDVVRRVSSMNVPRVVVSGGEPLVQAIGLQSLVAALVEKGLVVEIETNGTHQPNDVLLGLVSNWNVSPKLSHSGVPREKAWKPEVLRNYVEKIQEYQSLAFKFVVQQNSDFDEIEKLRDLTDIPSKYIWIMPEGRTPQELESRLPAISEKAINRGYNITNRLHVEIWGDKRGV